MKYAPFTLLRPEPAILTKNKTQSVKYPQEFLTLNFYCVSKGNVSQRVVEGYFPNRFTQTRTPRALQMFIRVKEVFGFARRRFVLLKKHLEKSYLSSRGFSRKIFWSKISKKLKLS